MLRQCIPECTHPAREDPNQLLSQAFQSAEEQVHSVRRQQYKEVIKKRSRNLKLILKMQPETSQTIILYD